MNHKFKKSQITLAITAAIGATTMATISNIANAAKTQGKYVAGDFHNHTTCSDGSISMQKLVKKATDKVDTPWGLDWFVQAGHGGSGNRNCTLAEDASLATPAYPLVSSNATPPAVLGPTTTWHNSKPAVQPKGLPSGSAPNQNMWRWQSVQEFQYPLLEYLAAYKNLPLFLGIETVVPGHEHSSMSIITGQMPTALDTATLPSAPPYNALGNPNALAHWEYCFDRNDTDTSRGNTTVGTTFVPGGNNWDCSVTGSLNSADASWNTTAQKLMPSNPNVGTKGHNKTLEALKWIVEKHPNGSYYVPSHLERAGPFNPNGNNGFNIEHLRNFNNAAPNVAFGFETQPGHGASDARGEYTIRRNNFGGTPAVNVDSVGGTTYGGTGVYGAQIGGVWDALLGEGRNWWFFASSDWHNRGTFGPDDRRSSQDFLPGEYQRNYTLVRNGADPKLRPQTIVDGLRSGNSFVASGQLIDRLAFIACVSPAGAEAPANLAIQERAVALARNNTDGDFTGCAFMGEKLVVNPGADVIISIVVRDPAGTNYSPYTFDNPSLAQVGISQPLNTPALDHIDVIRGMVTGYKTPGAADYSGEWPRNWIAAYRAGGTPSLTTVPAAAKNLSATVLKTFNNATWAAVSTDTQFKKMTFRIKAVNASQYVRMRGTNLPPSVPFETDANGNPLPDLWTNAAAVNPSTAGGSDGMPANANLRIPCKVAGTTEFNGCPSHLPTITIAASDGTPAHTGKAVAYDVAAWSDLWFYSNPIYIQVNGSTQVTGVK
ncbi:MAG: hypothetical protein V4568_00015 [Pseudomonadota bacterium]